LTIKTAESADVTRKVMSKTTPVLARYSDPNLSQVDLREWVQRALQWRIARGSS